MVYTAQNSGSLQEKLSSAAIVFLEAPAESAAFAIAGAISYVLKSSFSSPLFGIAFGILASQLALKALNHYNKSLLIRISKQVCLLNNKFPKLRMILLISSLATSLLLSQRIGWILGIGTGCFSAIVLNIENSKLAQRSHRSI